MGSPEKNAKECTEKLEKNSHTNTKRKLSMQRVIALLANMAIR